MEKPQIRKGQGPSSSACRTLCAGGRKGGGWGASFAQFAHAFASEATAQENFAGADKVAQPPYLESALANAPNGSAAGAADVAGAVSAGPKLLKLVFELGHAPVAGRGGSTQQTARGFQWHQCAEASRLATNARERSERSGRRGCRAVLTERVCRCSGCWRKGVGLCGGCSKGIGGACGLRT